MSSFINNKKYEDIINMPHHVSKKHPQMSLEARSAQFAPFAALTGYEDAVEETARLTVNKKEINEEQKEVLDKKLKIIKKNISQKPKITITYYIQDSRKQGGKYVTITGNIIKIDEYNQKIILEDKTQIPILDILEITI